MPKTFSAQCCSLILAACFAPVSSFAKTVTVHPGESIQAAIDAAAAGTTIKVLPGTYQEGKAGDLNAVTITKPGIRLMGSTGKNRPVLVAREGQRFGIWVSPDDTIGPSQNDVEHPPCARSGKIIEGFSIVGFEIRDFAEHGLQLACVNNFRISNNVSAGNLVYGLFPIVSTNGVVANNVAYDTPLDAAIYVGQSENVTVTGNVTYDSTIGIELENTRRCKVIGNTGYHNAVGMVMDSAPALERPQSRGNLVASNRFFDNNRVAESDEEQLPPGIGLLFAAVDQTIVWNNRITGNNSFGILLSTRVCPDDPTCGDPTFNPTSNKNWIFGNRVSGNGTVATGNPQIDPLRADYSWDGAGSDNCWLIGSAATSASPLGPDLPACTFRSSRR